MPQLDRYEYNKIVVYFTIMGEGIIVGDARYKQRHKEQGLCVDCSNPVVPGFIWCASCREKNRIKVNEWNSKNKNKIKIYRKKRKLYRIANRLCSECGDILGEQDDGYKQCINCRLRITNRRP